MHCPPSPQRRKLVSEAVIDHFLTLALRVRPLDRGPGWYLAAEGA